ncbi:MAG: ribosome silencing factor [Hyphomicrobiaceae bacterium]|nr:ribosome silencing factor [Hyphomicrobiaceae bacterium]
MRTTVEAAALGTPPTEMMHESASSEALLKQIVLWLDEAKAEDIVTIDLAGKTSFGDFMVIASGRTDRHVGSLADTLQEKLKDFGAGRARVEGMQACDWVLVDTGDIIIHLFRPEVREFYNLEKMWSGERPADSTSH